VVPAAVVQAVAGEAMDQDPIPLAALDCCHW
jgi:hypothetical protein